jgi:hypothetical protein
MKHRQRRIDFSMAQMRKSRIEMLGDAHCALARSIAQGAQPERQHADCESYVANWIIPVEIAVIPQTESYAEDFVI